MLRHFKIVENLRFASNSSRLLLECAKFVPSLCSQTSAHHSNSTPMKTMQPSCACEIGCAASSQPGSSALQSGRQDSLWHKTRQRACGNAENLYEEVEPKAVLDARLSDGGREFLVKFPDAEEDSWVSWSLCQQHLMADGGQILGRVPVQPCLCLCLCLVSVLRLFKLHNAIGKAAQAYLTSCA